MAQATVMTPLGPIGADGKAILYMIGGIVVVYWLWKGQLKHDTKAVAQAINPVNPDNVFNRAFEGSYQGIVGSDQPPGADLYDKSHNPDGTVKGGSWSPFYWLDKAIL